MLILHSLSVDFLSLLDLFVLANIAFLAILKSHCLALIIAIVVWGLFCLHILSFELFVLLFALCQFFVLLDLFLYHACLNLVLWLVMDNCILSG
jgi:hypothetical protein